MIRKLLSFIVVLFVVVFLFSMCSSDSNSKKIEIGKELEVNGAHITLHSITIKDDKASLNARWNNKTSHEAHLAYLAPLDVKQGDNYLEVIDDEKLNRKVKSGIDGNLNIDIKLHNNTDDLVLIFLDGLDGDDKEEVVIKID